MNKNISLLKVLRFFCNFYFQVYYDPKMKKIVQYGFGRLANTNINIPTQDSKLY